MPANSNPECCCCGYVDSIKGMLHLADPPPQGVSGHVVFVRDTGYK